MITPPRIYIHYLKRMEKILRKVKESDQEAVLQNRLYQNMFPMLIQARTAIGFSLRSSCPLAGREIVSFANEDPTINGLTREIEQTIEYLQSIPDEDYLGINTTKVSTAAGFADHKLSGWDYFLMYTLPNFFFHYGMVYAIARQAGVPIGKSDFDGYHMYPAGFTFSNLED